MPSLTKYSDGTEWTCHDVCMHVTEIMCSKCNFAHDSKCSMDHKSKCTCLHMILGDSNVKRKEP